MSPTEEFSAPVIDGVNMDEVVLVDQGGSVGGTVTFTEDVSLLAGLTADTNILDSCDFGRVGGGGGSGGQNIYSSSISLFISIYLLRAS